LGKGLIKPKNAYPMHKNENVEKKMFAKFSKLFYLKLVKEL
jgi:hypothetical protein